jgi:antitoxin component YwqK of YwqJK toxin-antitoxin module
MPAMRHLLPILSALVLGAAASNAHAIQVCELDGQHVNPANGHTTAGKTGLMRCREGEGGPVVREQELQNGVFMGVVRYFKDGNVQREHSVNERGNRDGRAREYEGKQLVLEETYRNAKVVGLSKRWHANGQLRRVSFHGEDDREQASAEFTKQGQLADLRCAPQPQLAPLADDAAWCGHKGGAGTVSTYAEDGRLRGKLVHERGERRLSEAYWDNGKPRERTESTAAGGTERSFTDSGTPRRERQWVNVEDSGRTRRSTVLEREYHESGTLVQEKRWTPGPRGSELQSERRWYLNGQPRETVTYTQADGRTLRHDVSFHDNGKPAHEGDWLLAGRYERQASGVHKSFDTDGRLRLERHHDAKGRLTRERELDESGKVTRDDELFEDGSRKAHAR